MKGVHILETLSDVLVKSREVKEQSEAGAGGREEIVDRNVKLSSDLQSWGAEHVDDESEDGGGVRDGLEGLVDIRVAEG